MSVIEIKMSAIYRAAHEELPAQATAFGSHAELLTTGIGPAVDQLALAGGHPLGGDLADLSVELFAHLRTLVRTFNDSAVALDRIADDFVEVDAEAAAWLAQHQRYLGDPDLPTEPTAPEV
ncbi:hypothetical protein ACIRN4_00765 [Pimelobacter simplex]|uniref:ESX-1 secretion-associated protein n=1 Tax=Nocardioides simplex TaxID=2045 RepID=A0A7J5E2G9_NOCSI|nr:hypothetical protein [Pimelobacter simplex]KAB2812393.1 hypothetical protein F9L07_11500 [Pimelobacter simplex]